MKNGQEQEMIGWSICLSETEYEDAKNDPNKDYELGILLGKAEPIYAKRITKKEKEK